MDKFMNACLIGSLVFMLGLAGAGTYEFGSKVALGDTDVGNLLYNCDPQPRVMYWDIGANGIYDQDDVVYLVMTSKDKVSVNDVRLTDFDSFKAGTKVKNGTDPDEGKDLTDFHTQPIIAFSNLYTGPGYDFLDPLYIHVPTEETSGDEAETETNDVRLIAIDGLGAGSKVFDFHGDHNKKLISMGFASIRFFNANGNVDLDGKPIYDGPDNIYIDISLPPDSPFGFVSINDLRLSV